MTRKALDPNLASILDSIRATVGGEPAPQTAPANEPAEPEPGTTEAEAAADAAEDEPARPAKGSRRAAPALPQPAAAPLAPSGSAGSRTVEEFLAELIRPQLDAWLRANLPELIQKMAADEIARLTGRR
jgi:cell pole-organizing protein PopZ